MILDVRNDSERKQGQFKDSVNIPLNDLRCRAHELDPNTEYIITCHSGLRSYIGERMLKQAGFKVKNLDGAFAFYHTVLPEELEYV